MSLDRKRVTLYGDDRGFCSAISSLIDDLDTTFREHLDGEVDRSDLALWCFTSDINQSALARLAERVPTLVIAEPDALLSAVDAGARGFLSRGVVLDRVRDAVNTMLDGGSVIPPEHLGTLLRHVVDRRRVDSAIADSLEELTRREREIYALAVKGLRKDEIAEALFISPATARTHLQRVYKKLGIHSQAELIATHANAGAGEEVAR